MLERRVIDMTIDEAITRERKIAKEQRSHIGTWYSKIMGYDDEYIKKCEVCAEEHEQLAEWLEELKAYQQHEIICNKGYNAGYNKAIDDFVAFTKEHEYKYGNADITSIVIGFNEFIAEQLKGGVSNENCV